MSNDIKISRELAEQILSGAPVKPKLDDYCCVGCGNWMPVGHPEAHEHEDGCPEEVAAERRHWKSELRALLAAEPSNKCGRCGASTVEGCNYLGCHFLESGNGAPVVERQEPVAWANWKVGTKSYVPFRSREEASRSVENSEISATQLGPYRVVPLYAEQPSPVAVVLPRDPEKAFFEWTDTLPSAPRCLQTWLAAIDKLKELNQ